LFFLSNGVTLSKIWKLTEFWLCTLFSNLLLCRSHDLASSSAAAAFSAAVDSFCCGADQQEGSSRRLYSGCASFPWAQ
jgi:hypothetical protein